MPTHTMSFWRIEAWSLNVGFYGHQPFYNWHEKPWAEGSAEALVRGDPLFSDMVFMFPFLITGDLDLFSNDLKCKHRNSKNPCWECDEEAENQPVLREPRKGSQYKVGENKYHYPSEHAVYTVVGYTMKSNMRGHMHWQALG